MIYCGHNTYTRLRDEPIIFIHVCVRFMKPTDNMVNFAEQLRVVIKRDASEFVLVEQDIENTRDME